MMDEYLDPVPDGGFRHVNASAHHSCRRFGREEIVGRLNAGTPGTPIPEDNLWLPDVNDPGEYDDRLQAAGGVDLFILASGATDGHVGFNPPGTSADSRTRVIELAAGTRKDNLETFPEFAALDDVPHYGVTVGPRTLVDLSQRLVMVLIGTDKRQAFDRVSRATSYQPDWPATVIAQATNADVYADQAAAGFASNA